MARDVAPEEVGSIEIDVGDGVVLARGLVRLHKLSIWIRGYETDANVSGDWALLQLQFPIRSLLEPISQ